MTFGQLRAFLAVVRTGSVRAAAASLYVSEPSISAAVTALEREIGAALLERHGRGVRPSAAGESFARAASEALGLLEQGAETARAHATPGTGKLRLAAVTTAGEAIVPPLLRAFREHRPAVEPMLEVGNRAVVLERLAAREVDVAIGGRPPQSGGIVGEAFLANPLVIVAAASHPLAGAHADPAALAAETWLLREPGSGTRATSDEFLESAGIAAASKLTIGSNGAIRQAAVDGLGIALVSWHAVAGDLANGTLATISADGIPVARDWYALRLERGGLPPAARDFLAFLRSPSARKVLPSPSSPARRARPARHAGRSRGRTE